MAKQIKCAICGKKFTDKILPQLKQVNPEFASRIWCNDCVAKKWKDEETQNLIKKWKDDND